MKKKNYLNPVMKEIEVELTLLSEVSGETGESGTKEGEGDDQDYSRWRKWNSLWDDEDVI